MKVTRRTLLAMVLLAGVMILGACTQSQSTLVAPAAQPDSGSTNEHYQGSMHPDIPKQFKLSEEEQKNGLKKIPIRAKDGRILQPEVRVESTPAPNSEPTGGGDVAKPQV